MSAPDLPGEGGTSSGSGAPVPDGSSPNHAPASEATARRSARDRWIRVLLVVAVVLVLALAGALYYFRPTVVPDLRTKDENETTALLQAVGLKLGETGQIATSTVGGGLVFAQSPAAGQRAPRHSSVDVTVAVVPVPTPVPNVVGKSDSEAAKVLSATLFQPVAVTVYGVDAPVGTVVQQLPNAESMWVLGRPVPFAVSGGSAPEGAVKVPNLSGMSPDAALAALAAAGLGAQGVVVNISDPQSNVLTGQLPGPGTVVDPGTTVLLLFEEP